MFLPLLTNSQDLAQWNTYSQLNTGWIERSRSFQLGSHVEHGEGDNGGEELHRERDLEEEHHEGHVEEDAHQEGYHDEEHLEEDGYEEKHHDGEHHDEEISNEISPFVYQFERNSTMNINSTITMPASPIWQMYVKMRSPNGEHPLTTR